jgi:EmrB/QacA subfamily drug resistance transporter
VATHRPLTVIGLVLSLFMAALEATVVSTAMPTVIGDLGGIQHYSWVFTAYLVASTVTVPVFGKLADMYGRKPIVLAGSALFLLGSVSSGAARSMTQLIVFRTVQGLGAGALQPVALTIVGDIFSFEERARVQGAFGAVWGLAGIIGPMLGGLIVKNFSWRWVFYLNVPVGIASTSLLIVFFKEEVTPKRHVIDVAGALLLAGVVVALLAGAGGGTRALVMLPLAALLLSGFLLVERRAREPILPLALYRKRVIAVSSIAGALVGGAMFAIVTYVPLFVQGVLRAAPTAAGSAIAPMVIGWPIASALGGRFLRRAGFRPLIRLGLAIAALASLGLALAIARGPSLNEIRAASACFGIGLGFANTALLIAVQTSVEWQQRGVATAGTLFFRSIGGALAVGGMGGVLTGFLTRDHGVPLSAANDLLGPGHGRQLAPAVLESLRGALQSGLGLVFWIACSISLVAFATSWIFPHIPLDGRRDAA